MSSTVKTLDVRLLDREMRVTCPDEERLQLLDAVSYLDEKMRVIRDSGKANSMERIALMAALNITHELLSLKASKGIDVNDFKRRIAAMQAAIDSELAAQNSLQ